MSLFTHLFAVQACRGVQDDKEVPPDIAPTGDDSDTDEDDGKEANLDAVPIDDDLKAIKQQWKDDILRAREDFLVLLAAREGYASYRTDSGSYMLRSLCKEIKLSTVFDDLPEVMERCRYRTYKMSGKKQVPQIISTLRAKLCIKRYAKEHDNWTILVFDRVKHPWGKDDNHDIKNAYPVHVTSEEYEKLTKKCECLDWSIGRGICPCVKSQDEEAKLLLAKYGFRSNGMK